VAAGIRAARPDRTVAIVGQDVSRRNVLGTGDATGGHATGLVELTTRYLLGRGFDVVLEGILNAEWYGDVLRRLVVDHRGTTCCYLYDLSFDETARRHATTPSPPCSARRSCGRGGAAASPWTAFGSRG
jgi:hypothetical protein